MPPRELADRKRALVNELNSYIALKKNYASADEARGELMTGGGGAAGGGETATGGERVNPYESGSWRGGGGWGAGSGWDSRGGGL